LAIIQPKLKSRVGPETIGTRAEPLGGKVAPVFLFQGDPRRKVLDDHSRFGSSDLKFMNTEFFFRGRNTRIETDCNF
jgi:hypothetical protein